MKNGFISKQFNSYKHCPFYETGECKDRGLRSSPKHQVCIDGTRGRRHFRFRAHRVYIVVFFFFFLFTRYERESTKRKRYRFGTKKGLGPNKHPVIVAAIRGRTDNTNSAIWRATGVGYFPRRKI